MLTQLEAKSPQSIILLMQSRMQDFKGVIDCDFALCVFTVVSYLPDVDSLAASLLAAFRSLKPGGQLLIDVPSRNIFASYSRSDNQIHRKVTVQETAPNVFSYHEELVIRTSEGESSYKDDFQIHYWQASEVITALENAGFCMIKDCSDRFAGTGSNYYLMQKPAKGMEDNG